MFPLSTGLPLIRKSTSIPGTDVVPFKVLPKTVMLPLPMGVVEVNVVVEFVFEVVVEVVVVVGVDDVEVVVVVGVDDVEVVVVVGVDDVEVVVVVGVDDVEVVVVVGVDDVEVVVVVGVDDVEVETVVTDELGKIRGLSTRVNRTSDDTKMTIMIAPTVTLLVLLIVSIRT